MAEYDGVVVSQLDGGVVLVRLNRPPHNFIEQPMVSAIADAYERAAASPGVRAIVLAASGKNFCAGANFAATPSAAARGQASGTMSAETVFQTYGEGARLMAAPLPVVAAINGAAVGGGLGLACTADFRVGSLATRLVPNFAQLGVHHGFGLTVTMPRIAGQQRTNELLLSGKRIGGEEAFRCGLLDRLVSDDDLEAAAIAFAREVAASAPLAVRAIRATMRQGLVEEFRAAAKWESEQQAILSATEDFREGVRASSERRPPRFTGR